MILLQAVILVCFLLIGTIGLQIVDWLRFNFANLKSNSFGSVVKLKWKHIVQFYNTNSRRWRYEKIAKPSHCCVFPLTTDEEYLLFNSGDRWEKSAYTWPVYCNADKIVRVQLSFFDYLRFLYFKKNRNKSKKRKDTKGLELIIQATQNDVDALRQISIIETDKARAKANKLASEVLKEGIKLEL